MFVSVVVTGDGNHVHLECLGQQKSVLFSIDPQRVVFNTEPPKRCQANKKRRRRKATKQEEAAADLHGGRRHKGSGSLPYLKSDASTRGKYRMECKSTAGLGIRITRADLDKIRSECDPGQVPVYMMQFNEPTTLRTQDEWVMVPKKEWERRIATDD